VATCDSLRDMSPRPPQDAATWHDALRAADARAHQAEAERDTLLRRFLAADALLARRALRRLARTVRRR
jgi:hypothetical protein